MEQIGRYGNCAAYDENGAAEAVRVADSQPTGLCGRGAIQATKTFPEEILLGGRHTCETEYFFGGEEY